MSIQLLSFAAGFAAFVLYVVLFLILMRFRLGMGWFGLQIVSGILVHILASILFFSMLDGFLYWYALGVFSVCWFFFFMLSTAIYVSVSARVLRTIDQQPAQALMLDEIYDICIRQQFEERIEFLVASGLAQKKESGFRITAQGYKNAQRLLSMRQFWGMEGSGLYSSVRETLR